MQDTKWRAGGRSARCKCKVQIVRAFFIAFFFQVFFIPLSNTIISCFKDDSIHAWESDSLEYKYEIPPPFGPTPRYRAFAAPQDGHVLVGGGRSNFLHVWAMESRQLLRIIQLPQYVRHVKQLIFLPNSYDGGSSEVRTSVIKGTLCIKLSGCP